MDAWGVSWGTAWGNSWNDSAVPETALAYLAIDDGVVTIVTVTSTIAGSMPLES